MNDDMKKQQLEEITGFNGDAELIYWDMMGTDLGRYYLQWWPGDVAIALRRLADDYEGLANDLIGREEGPDCD